MGKRAQILEACENEEQVERATKGMPDATRRTYLFEWRKLQGQVKVKENHVDTKVLRKVIANIEDQLAILRKALDGVVEDEKACMRCGKDADNYDMTCGHPMCFECWKLERKLNGFAQCRKCSQQDS